MYTYTWVRFAVVAELGAVEVQRLILPTMGSTIQDRDNAQGIVESNYQHHFSVNVWCGVIGDQLFGPYIFPQRLTGDIDANVLQDELPPLS